MGGGAWSCWEEVVKITRDLGGESQETGDGQDSNCWGRRRNTMDQKAEKEGLVLPPTVAGRPAATDVTSCPSLCKLLMVWGLSILSCSFPLSLRRGQVSPRGSVLLLPPLRPAPLPTRPPKIKERVGSGAQRS